jgi:hypothetical protein
MLIGRPNSNDAPDWYSYFFGLSKDSDLITALQESKQQTLDLISSIPASRADWAYAANKWTIKQVFIHLADEERYYTYKSFCCSRESHVNLEIPMGAKYTKDFNASNRSLSDVKEEYASVRDASITLFRSMTADMLDFKDLVAKDIYTARSLGWFALGHNLHHCKVLRETYLGMQKA